MSCAAVFSAAKATAKDRPLDFLQALENRGYGEVAVDYLERLQAGKRLPRELYEVWDLKLSEALRLSAAEAFNSKEREERLSAAEVHLNKFLTEHAEHPESAAALASWGQLAVDQGLDRLGRARAAKDAGQSAKYMAEARAAFELGRPRWTQAVERYLRRLRQLEKDQASDASTARRNRAAPTPKQRDILEQIDRTRLSWLDARLKLPLIDYYVAQTYPDLKDKLRRDLLARTGEEFDRIFQENRGSLAGMYAHMWQGRCAADLGDSQLALDIYDEVLAVAPDAGREHTTGLESLFAQVNFFRLQAFQSAQGQDDFIAEARQWLKLNKAWRDSDGYQGVALELSKSLLGSAETAKGEDKSRMRREAMALLQESAKVRSEHQQEAILLRREHLAIAPPEVGGTLDEALALGDEAARGNHWEQAVSAYTRAVELSQNLTNRERAKSIHARLIKAQYRRAVELLAEGKAADALSTAEEIAHNEADSGVAPAASSLALSAALALYAGAKDSTEKQSRLDHLVQLADYAIQQWPDKPEADDARLALGQAGLVREEFIKAIEVFENVNARSLRKPLALYLAGQTHWRMYLAEKSKAPGKRDASAMATHLGRAEEQLRASFDAQRNASEASQPALKLQQDTRLLLAELCIETGKNQQATELLEPLVETLKQARLESIDSSALRTFLAGARAYVAVGESAKAVAAALSLADKGVDTQQVNAVLISLTKLLMDDLKRLQAVQENPSTAGQPSSPGIVATSPVELRQKIGRLLAKLAPRQQNTISGMITIADANAQIGQTDLAQELYDRVLRQADADPAFRRSNAQALARIQAQLVDLLRQKGQYAEGLKQVDELIRSNPKSLAALMVKGQILQAWAETEPARFEQAVEHWSTLRARLSTLRQKPPEYFDVVYNTAYCLLRQSEFSRDPGTAATAAKLLMAVRTQNPNLDGAQMTARYDALLVRIKAVVSTASQARPLGASASK